MKTRRASSILGLILLGATLIWAGQPWEEKPYTEWTEKEVQEIAQNSPWAHPFRTLGSGQVDLSQPSQPRGQQTGPSPSVPSMDGGGGGTAGSGSLAGGGRRTIYIIQWASSLTIRQTMVQREALQGDVNEEAAAQFLSNTPPSYILILFGPDMRGFEDVNEETVRESAYLELKKSDQKILPEEVVFLRQGPRLVAVQFFFPREKEGVELISPEEKKVQFYCESSTTPISAEFDLRKMVRHGKLDL